MSAARIRIKEYYQLAKPGLVYGNLITAIAGFLVGCYAAHIGIASGSFFAMLVGIAFVMGSGCVLNNVIDQDIDGAMDRTKHRALVAGVIPKRKALAYGIGIGVVGFALLLVFTNVLAFVAAAVGFGFYVVCYSLWAKRHSVWSTLVGSVAGAMPPVVGYVAAAGRLDLGALLLFAILVLWQIPHFYAIGIYRLDDYTSAHIPILPAKQGIGATKWAMLGCVIAFAFVAPLLAVFGYADTFYFYTAIILAMAWFVLALWGFTVNDSAQNQTLPASKRWARKMFFLSLIVMTVLFATLAITSLLKIY